MAGLVAEDWRELRQPPPRHTAIEVVDARTAEDLSARQSPAVIKDLAAGWPAARKWASAEALHLNYGNVAFALPDDPKKSLTLNEFLAYAEENTVESPSYLVERAFEGERSALLEDFTVPPMFSDDLMALVPGSRRARYWFVGGVRTGTFLHVDPLCTSAWNTVRCCVLIPHAPLGFCAVRTISPAAPCDQDRAHHTETPCAVHPRAQTVVPAASGHGSGGPRTRALDAGQIPEAGRLLLLDGVPRAAGRRRRRHRPDGRVFAAPG